MAEPNQQVEFEAPVDVKTAARFLGVSPRSCMLMSSVSRFPISE